MQLTTATGSPVSPNASCAMGSPRLPVLGNVATGSSVRAGNVQAAQGYPTEHGGKYQPEQVGRANSQQLRVV